MAENEGNTFQENPPVVTPGINPISGTAGYKTQVPGQASTVSGAANATGGINEGNFVQRDIDEDLFRFQNEDTALMTLMLKAKKVKVNSPEVDHYMIDQKRPYVEVGDDDITIPSKSTAKLVLNAEDIEVARQYKTLLVEEATIEGGTVIENILLYVVGVESDGHPVVRIVNDTGNKAVTIKGHSTLKLLSNAMYETQKEVDPDLIIPQPETVYLQKRGMNQIVSDYFDSQKKRIPFTQATIAEQAILNFKRDGNRTLWAGKKGKLTLNVPKLGQQNVYFTEGIRWQFKRQTQAPSTNWTISDLIALAKMYFTGEDVPRTALLLAGKNLLEQIQSIDFSQHPEIHVTSTQNATLGWSVTRIHTVFGDIDIKREPTLDTLGWSNSGALIGEDRLVHYTYSVEHEFSDRVEGEEATRKGIVVWDALALKGACHIWIEGEKKITNSMSENVVLWNGVDEDGKYIAPTINDVENGVIYYIKDDVTLTDTDGTKHTAQNGTCWLATKVGSTLTWSKYTKMITAK